MRSYLLAVAALLLPGAATAQAALDAEEIRFVELINEYRAANGLHCLSVSPTMNVAADFLSHEMGETGFFSHLEPPCEGKVCTGRGMSDRLVDFGHTGWGIAGENIAAGTQMDAARAFAGWRNSPGHNQNMLEPRFTAMGIARAEVPGSFYGVYWTNDFSDLVDGDHDCEQGLPAIGSGAPGGSGGDGGSGGGGGDAADEGGGRRKGGCETAGGLSILGFAVTAIALRGRRAAYLGR